MVANNAFLLKEMKEESEVRGERKLLIKQLTKAIGILPEGISTKIMVLPIDKVEEIGGEIFHIKTIEQLEGHLNS